LEAFFGLFCNFFFSFFFSAFRSNWRIKSGLPVQVARMCKIKYGTSDRKRSPNIPQRKAAPTIPIMTEDWRESVLLISLFLARPVSFLGISSSFIKYFWICNCVRLTHVLFFTHKHGIIYSGINCLSERLSEINKSLTHYNIIIIQNIVNAVLSNL